MTVSTIPPVTPLLKFFDNNGAPLAYGQLFTYQTATSTKQATYTDSTGNTPNTNPIILDARGECICWLDSSLVYKFVIAPSTDTDPPTNAIRTEDPIGAFSITQITGNFTTITVSAQAQVAYLNVTGSTLPANGVYLPATNRLGFSTNTKARGYIDSGGIWTILAPDASGPALSVAGLGTNNTNTIQLPTAGSMINFARSSDGALNGFVGSRAGTSNYSIYNSGGTTAEVEVTGSGVNLKTSGATALAVDNHGTVAIAATTGGNTGLTVTGAAALGANFIAANGVAAANFDASASNTAPIKVTLAAAINKVIETNTGASTGAATPAALTANKPGSNNSVFHWISVNIGGTNGYIPVWGP